MLKPFVVALTTALAAAEGQPQQIIWSIQDSPTLPGDYALSDNPDCPDMYSTLLKRFRTEIATGSALAQRPHAAGDVTRYLYESLTRPSFESARPAVSPAKIGGLLGALLVPASARRATCTAFALLLPGPAADEDFLYQARELNDNEWSVCSVEDNCLEGWSRWERAGFVDTKSGRIYLATFKNWSADRARVARFGARVGFKAPAVLLNPRSLVTLTIPGRFPSQDKAAAFFALVMAAIPAREVAATPSSEPGAAALEVLAVPTQFPALRELVAARARELNAGRHGGALLVPGLPRLAHLSLEGALGSVPMSYARLDLDSGARLVGTPRVWSDPGVLTGPDAEPEIGAMLRLDLWVPSDTAEPLAKLVAPALDGAVATDQLRALVGTEPIGLVLASAAAAADADPEWLGDAPAADPQETAAPAQLVIVDSSWPDATEAKRSIERFSRWLSEARAGMGLASINLSLPGSWLEPNCKVPDAVCHAGFVRSSLGAALDDQRVEVTYLPLSAGEESRDLLAALLSTAYLIREFRVTGAMPSSRLEATSKEAANKVLEGVPSAPRSPEMESDRSILASLIDVLDFLGTKNHRNYIVNYSWTVRNPRLRTQREESRHVFVVTAAGNVSSVRPFEEPSIEFVVRAALSKDTLAVFSSDNRGGVRTDCSTSLSEAEAKSALTVVFPGELGKLCGTSFAAPRVAWLLALAERLRVKAVPAAGWTSWMGDVIRAARNDASRPMKLDVHQLFVAAATP